MSNFTPRHGIVVGVDGSASSKVAVDWAARAAALRNVLLTIVYIGPSMRTWPGRSASPEIEKRYAEQGEELLGRARHIAGQASDTIDLRSEMFTGTPLPALIKLADDAELIVVGRRGLGEISGRMMGSVSRGLLQQANCPVAIIHDEDPLLGSPVEDAPVVVGLDGSPPSEAAGAIAFAEAALRGVELVAVHAWSDNPVYEFIPIEWSEKRRDAESDLAEWLAPWQQQYQDVRIRRIVVRDQPAQELLKQSESAQLVVVGSQGRGGLARMLLGSVSSAVVESVRRPVIVARSS